MPDAGGPDELVADLALVDHHCHSVVTDELDRSAFELLLGESDRPAPPGCSQFDTALGLAVRSECAPVLGLPSGSAADAYIEARSACGAEEVNRRFLRAAGVAELLVDTGYRPAELAPLGQLADWAGGTAREIVRLESLAAGVAAELAAGARPPAVAGVDYADALTAAVAEARSRAVGWKSVAAYRCGLDLDWRRPRAGEVRQAAADWLAAGPAPGAAPGDPDGWRLTDPVLIRFGVWAAVDTAMPVQFHTGFGDTDVRLSTASPALLDGLVAATVDTGAAIMLLHCWPFHREAGYLAHVWPHVYLDVGEAVPHVGHRSPAVLAEALELAPWHKVLYSSDAFGLAELHHLGAALGRRALAATLRPLAAHGAGFEPDELARLAGLVATGNARRVH
ncbi:MAG TPA: amidohydrolase family protein, partial [Acidimicrobiales bacterium]|nr:amidohydrolase family protein [Acidimicrobiales bacterium]